MTGPLREGLADYLALRRALGYRLVRPEKLLGQFLNHLERAGESRVTVAAEPNPASRCFPAREYMNVQRFPVGEIVR